MGRPPGCSTGVFLLLLAALSWSPFAVAEQREVRTCEEMRVALNDPVVHHVLVVAVPGGLNCTEQDMPPLSVALTRKVLLEGQGPEQVYIDFNRVEHPIVVSDGGMLHMKNLWADDAITSGTPVLLTFASFWDRSGCILENVQVSDATCVMASKSDPITKTYDIYMDEPLAVEGRPIYPLAEYIDDRTLLVRDSGLRPGFLGVGHDPNAAWLDYKYHTINTTFTCTGGITHPLPDGFELVEVETLSRKHRTLMAAGSILLLVLVVAWGFFYWRSTATDSPEFAVAASKGYVLEAPLGAGHFGRVYKAHNKTTRQVVAVKVVSLLPKQRRQVAAAWKECKLLSQLKHECIVQVIAFYAAQVQRNTTVLEPVPGNEYAEVGFQVDQLVNQGDSLPGSLDSGSSSGGANLGNASNVSSSSSSLDGVLSLQVQLVMQYCDMGTLEQAIRQGVFLDPDTGKPRMRHILLTALDIARGLEYLHQAGRRLVHRDLTATSVLLATHTDERGFRALLSDFGLSTSLTEEQSHKTSEVKGTLSYMSPEVFMHDDISPAVDIYSAGIILHMLHAGVDPYGGKTSAQIVFVKVRACSHPEEVHMPPMEGCAKGYQQLAWDCTNGDRRKRPSAEQLVKRIEALLLETA